MNAVHFGAGNIGRGFIGKILIESGYETVFVDVDEPLINALNEQKSYHVFYAEEEKRSFQVSNVSGLHSQQNEEEIINKILHADLITTAVGAHILPHVAPLIAKALKNRVYNSDQLLNIIACENAIGGTDLLKTAIQEHLSEDELTKVEQLVGFPNAAVDRIVPNQSNDNLLDVLVESFSEWVVDSKAYKGDLPSIDGLLFVEKLDAYIERKLFTVNTSHALTAYAGYQAGKNTVQESLLDQNIKNAVKEGLTETGKLICEKHDFNSIEHQLYIEKTLERFANPHITDEVTRVGRQPIKKLGINERLVNPTRQLMAQGYVPEGLLHGIALTLKYDYSNDIEAVELQQKIKDQGVRKAFSQISGLAEDDQIVEKVAELYYR